MKDIKERVERSRGERGRGGRSTLRAIPALLLAAIAGLLAACQGLGSPDPVKIIAAQIDIGNDNVCQKLVGMHYTLENASSKDISSLHISFYLYDTSGNPVPLGNNYFDITFSAPFPAGSEISGCTSLDSSFSYLPTVSLVAYQFHLYTVSFSDGSSWTDWLGQYFYPYPVTSVTVGS